jgi:hypothetical protein
MEKRRFLPIGVDYVTLLRCGGERYIWRFMARSVARGNIATLRRGKMAASPGIERHAGVTPLFVAAFELVVAEQRHGNDKGGACSYKYRRQRAGRWRSS